MNHRSKRLTLLNYSLQVFLIMLFNIFLRLPSATNISRNAAFQSILEIYRALRILSSTESMLRIG